MNELIDHYSKGRDEVQKAKQTAVAWDGKADLLGLELYDYLGQASSVFRQNNIQIHFDLIRRRDRQRRVILRQRDGFWGGNGGVLVVSISQAADMAMQFSYGHDDYEYSNDSWNFRKSIVYQLGNSVDAAASKLLYLLGKQQLVWCSPWDIHGPWTEFSDTCFSKGEFRDPNADGWFFGMIALVLIFGVGLALMYLLGL